MKQYFQLRGIAKELNTIGFQLQRIADALEADLALKGYNTTPPVADTSGPEPSFEYVNEELDWAKENIPGFVQREDYTTSLREN